MNSTKTPSVSTPVESAAAPVAPVAQTQEPTFSLTASEFQNLMADAVAQALASQGAASAPGESYAAGPEPCLPTTLEDCATHRLLSLLAQATSKVILAARDHVAVPAHIYAVDKATPQGLALIAAGSIVAASGARRVSDYFARLAETAAAKSAALTRR